MNKTVIIILVVVLAVGAGAAYILLKPEDVGKQYYYSVGEPFVTNVLDSPKLIKTAVVLGMSRDMEEELSSKSAVIRDSILYVLRNQTEEQYTQGDLQDQLSKAIVERLNEMFPPGEGAAPLFIKAYFNDFVMQ